MTRPPNSRREAPRVTCEDVGDERIVQEAGQLADEEVRWLLGCSDERLRAIMRQTLSRESVGSSGLKYAVEIDGGDWGAGEFELQLTVHVLCGERWRELPVVRHVHVERRGRSVS